MALTELQKLKRDRAAHRRIRRERRAAGMCSDCGVVKSPKGVICPDCRKARAFVQARRRAYFRSRGRCRDCGRHRAPGFKSCAWCLQKRADWEARRRRKIVDTRQKCAGMVPIWRGRTQIGERPCSHKAVAGGERCRKHGDSRQ